MWILTNVDCWNYCRQHFFSSLDNDKKYRTHFDFEWISHSKQFSKLFCDKFISKRDQNNRQKSIGYHIWHYKMKRVATAIIPIMKPWFIHLWCCTHTYRPNERYFICFFLTYFRLSVWCVCLSSEVYKLNVVP